MIAIRKWLSHGNPAGELAHCFHLLRVPLRLSAINRWFASERLLRPLFHVPFKRVR
jgi:hypothetical protein